MYSSRRFSNLLQLLLIIFAGLSISAQAQPQAVQVKTGNVQPEIKVLADNSHSYALYLPSKYSAQKLWPLLLAFDPGGEGNYPVTLFHTAAEKYGFIVAGSNNSRNYVDPSTAIRLLWQDVTSRFAIDPRRIYVTGFSGGARVASGLAVACKNCIAGVIACGAGLPPELNLPPAETSDWFLTAGMLDFNHAEITRLADAMDARHAATHLVFFPGPHSWMPEAVAEEALTWMQLRAMVKGTLPLDKNFVENEFTRQLATAQALQQSGGTLAAFRAYRQIIFNFHALRDTEQVQAMQTALSKSDELKRARKNEQSIFALEDRTEASINKITEAIIDRETPAGALRQEMESTMKDIRNDRDTTHDSARHDALTRAMLAAFAFARETGSADMLKKDYLAARDLFIAASLIRPEAAWPHYLVAQASAQLGENKQALEELRKSVDLGLNNSELLQSPEFDKLRANEAFKELISRMRQNAAAKSN